MGLAALLVSIALAVGAQTTMVGTALPPFTGEDLAGRKLTLPDASRGRVMLIAFGFSYGSGSRRKRGPPTPAPRGAANRNFPGIRCP